MADIELVELGADAPAPAPEADAPSNLPFCQVVYNVFKTFWKKNMAAKMLLCLVATAILINSHLTFVILQAFGVPLWKESIIISPNQVELAGKIDLDRIVMNERKITGFPNTTIEVCADTQLSISVGSGEVHRSSIFLGQNFINITGIATFKIFNAKTTEDMFFGGRPKLTIPKSVSHLKVKVVTTRNFTSEPKRGITFKSSENIFFRAGNGTNFLGSNCVLRTTGNITLESTHGAIILDGTNFHLNAIELPTLTEFEYHQNGQTFAYSRVEKNVDTFKLCFCITNQRIFGLRIPANISSNVRRLRCHHAKNVANLLK